MIQMSIGKQALVLSQGEEGECFAQGQGRRDPGDARIDEDGG